VTVLLLIALTGGAHHAATTYAVDSTRSVIAFSVRRMAVSTIRGRFTIVTGMVRHDAADASRDVVDVVIRTTSFDTDDKDRDRRLRGADFLEVRKYPDIHFVSRRIERAGAGLVAVGDLTVRGVTREVRVPYAFDAIGPTLGSGAIGITGSTKISRKDFDLMWRPNPELANLFVGDQVTIELNLVATLTRPGRS
jgi:polyisoprenoid-binding protein YceI